METEQGKSVNDQPLREDLFRLSDLSDLHRAKFLEGRELFNDGLYWEAHEAWEDVWKEKEDPQRRCIQGLIQAAAAYHLTLTNPRINGARRNFEKSLAKFAGMPAVCFEIRIDRLVVVLKETHGEIQRIGQEGFLKLHDRYIPKL